MLSPGVFLLLLLLFDFLIIFIFWVVRGVKGQELVQNDKRFSLWRSVSQDRRAKAGPKWQKVLSRPPYLRKRTSYDRHLWYLSDKWWYLQGFFSYFQKFWFSELLERWKNKNWSKMTKSFVCRIPYFRNHASYDHQLWHRMLKW